MFTGIIEELASVVSVDPAAGGMLISITATLVTSDISDGDSIAVNGVCLTAHDASLTGFSADISPETLERTTLGHLRPGAQVNLERAVTPTTRLGGHIVQG
ncbi:MAG TPA: riboflavin synthase, partial [Pyrinomonadaceae bacterium]|nr:riboflavin synthase [Pyrinomonadaceae bacterium]